MNISNLLCEKLISLTHIDPAIFVHITRLEYEISHQTNNIYIF